MLLWCFDQKQFNLQAGEAQCFDSEKNLCMCTDILNIEIKIVYTQTGD